MSNPRTHVWARALTMLAMPLALLLSAWAPPARATVLTISDTDSFVAVTGASGALTLDRFDATLGSLQGVKLEVSLSGAGEAGTLAGCSATVRDTCELKGNALFKVVLSLFAEGNLSLGFEAIDSAFVSCSLQPGTTQRCSGGPLDPGATQSVEVTDPLTLDLFDDPGSFLLHITKTTQLVFAPSTMSASATVTYTYDDGQSASVPEPGALASISLALLALVGTTRTRRFSAGPRAAAV